jgi:hypothetical protein
MGNWFMNKVLCLGRVQIHDLDEFLHRGDWGFAAAGTGSPPTDIDHPKRVILRGYEITS